jgi:excisionase family DNA binding protein
VSDEFQQEILSSEEVKAFLRLPKNTFYRLCADGILPCFKVGRTYRFRRSTLLEWIKAQETWRVEVPHA